MAEKYLINQASLTALGNIVRDYNETEDAYSLAEITRQLRENSENFKAMFTGTLSELKSTSATKIGRAQFGGLSISKVNLPNVTTIEENTFKYGILGEFNSPSLQTVGKEAFKYASFNKPVYWPSLTAIENSAFVGVSLVSAYFPSLEIIGAGSFLSGSVEGYVILKDLPTLQFAPHEWYGLFFMVPPGKFDDFCNDSNWAILADGGYIEEAVSFESDYDHVWEIFIENGILTEAEIRRDFYGES